MGCSVLASTTGRFEMQGPKSKETIMKVVVIGGSGLIGSKLVSKLREQGHEAVAASPKSSVKSITCEVIDEALKAALVVVDVTNSPSWEVALVVMFLEASARTLLVCEAAA